jgi:transposase
MSGRELNRLEVLGRVIERRRTQRQAAEQLGLSERQVRRRCRALSQRGAAGLVSRKRGRPSNRKLPAAVREQALALVRARYADFGPTLAREKLLEHHGVAVSTETLRQWMIGADLWVPRAQRPRRAHQPRRRRSCLGELVQIDGCEHAWFEDRGPKCTLLTYVDDATSRLMELHFAASESAFDYFAATRAYLERYGKPVAFYSDKASIFRVSAPEAPARPGSRSSAARSPELNIDILCANTPQAKGRVERAHLTLQDRLVKELRLRGISTPEAGNAYLPEFRADYNERFGREPESPHDAHRPVRDDEDLGRIFSWQEERKLSRNLTLHDKRAIYLVEPGPETLRLAGERCRVHEHEDGRIEIFHGRQPLPCRLFADPEPRVRQADVRRPQAPGRRAGSDPEGPAGAGSEAPGQPQPHPAAEGADPRRPGTSPCASTRRTRGVKDVRPPGDSPLSDGDQTKKNRTFLLGGTQDISNWR